jgi:hypothetical protein
MVADWEIPRIESIRSVEVRRIARLGVPGLAGDLQQDLGTASLAVEITGSLQGDEARDAFLESVRELFHAGEPVAFVADILTATELEQVLIEELELSEHNDAAGGFRYRIVLREYVEPPEPPTPIDDLGMDLDTDLDLLSELGLDGLELPDLLGDIPSLGNPVEPMKPALAGVDAATSGISGLLSGPGGLREKLGLSTT